MRDITVRYVDTGAPQEVRIAFLCGGRPWIDCFVKSSGPAMRRCGNALLCMGLLPALELNCDLRIDSPVDPDLLARVDAVQRLVASWTPGCKPVRISAPTGTDTYPVDRGLGLFFSGGVDSAYSLAVNRSRLAGIVTLIGCDIPVTNKLLGAWLAGISKHVAKMYGLESIIIETNLPKQMHPYIGWIEYHGSALAGIRHLLADHFSEMLVAASVDEPSLWDVAWGSHPGIDQQLGTAGATITLDGLVTRPQKLARILQEPELLRELRVCYDGGPNCGKCQKCLSTWICLDVLGGGRPLPSFPARRPPLNRAALAVCDVSVRNDMLSLRESAIRLGGHGTLVAAIDAAVAEFERRRPTLAERLRLKQWMRRARHRRRFAWDRLWR